MSNTMPVAPAVWFLAIRAGTGADVFTRRLCDGLNARGIRAGITWLPHRAEYLPWTVPMPRTPAWADVAHISTWLHPRFIPRHLPVVATLHHSVHDPAFLSYKGWLRAIYHRRWIAPIERQVLRRVQCVVAVSRFAADIAREILCDVPMQVIHNGIDVTSFRPPLHRNKPHSPFRLLYAGSWMARKGVDLLAPIMRELGNNFELHYTGAELGALMKSAPANVHNLGRLDQAGVIEAMHEADAFLFPSRSEGFGLVAAEAMACGLPVIATRGSSLPEVVEDGVTGLLCPQDEIEAFAQAIRRVAMEPGLWRGMSSNAVERVRISFSESAATDAYCRIYREMIERFHVVEKRL